MHQRLRDRAGAHSSSLRGAVRRDLTSEHDAVWRVPDCLVEDTKAHAAHVVSLARRPGDRGHTAPRPGEAASTGWRGIGAPLRGTKEARLRADGQALGVPDPEGDRGGARSGRASERVSYLDFHHPGRPLHIPRVVSHSRAPSRQSGASLSCPGSSLRLPPIALARIWKRVGMRLLKALRCGTVVRG
jgi:hypothetical protein